MDDTEILFFILVCLMFGAIGVVAYSYRGMIPPPQPLPFEQLEIYADLNMRAEIGSTVWWAVNYPDIHYTKILYLYNPNNFDITLDLFWESFPQEMHEFCEWSSTLEDGSVISPGLQEIRLYLLVRDNKFLVQGEIQTQIKARPPE